MKEWRKRGILRVWVLAIAIMAAGCGDDDNGGGNGSPSGDVNLETPSSVDAQKPVSELTPAELSAICEAVNDAVSPHQSRFDSAVSETGACTLGGLIVGGITMGEDPSELQRQDAVDQCITLRDGCLATEPEPVPTEAGACDEGGNADELANCSLDTGTYLQCLEDVYNNALGQIDEQRAFYDSLECDMLLDETPSTTAPDTGFSSAPATAACQTAEATCPGIFGGSEGSGS